MILSLGGYPRSTLVAITGDVQLVRKATGDEQKAEAASRSVKPAPRGKPSGSPFHAHFTDVAGKAGLRAPAIYGGADRKNYIVETVGCGCALFDYDNDGWLDILLLSGSRLEGPPEGATNRLYHNNRDGTFTDVTDRAGLRRSGWAAAVTIDDCNNDGFEDIFITYWGQNVLYRNSGDGTFTGVTREAGLLQSAKRWGTFVDYDRDGKLDLFVANYVDFDLKSTPKPGENSNCTWISSRCWRSDRAMFFMGSMRERISCRHQSSRNFRVDTGEL